MQQTNINCSSLIKFYNFTFSALLVKNKTLEAVLAKKKVLCFLEMYTQLRPKMDWIVESFHFQHNSEEISCFVATYNTNPVPCNKMRVLRHCCSITD